MPDVLGYRAKIAVVIPPTNTILEPELYDMAPHGVTFHACRMYVPTPAMRSPADMEAFLQAIRSATSVALRDALTLEPQHIIYGMSALSFWDGVEGSRKFKAG